MSTLGKRASSYNPVGALKQRCQRVGAEWDGDDNKAERHRLQDAFGELPDCARLMFYDAWEDIDEDVIGMSRYRAMRLFVAEWVQLMRNNLDKQYGGFLDLSQDPAAAQLDWDNIEGDYEFIVTLTPFLEEHCAKEEMTFAWWLPTRSQWYWFVTNTRYS